MNKTLDYLYGLKQFSKEFKLDWMKELTSVLDNPQNKIKTIHIAGTNGKGSTSAFLASILKTAGYKVGLYTSPHLIKFNERIQINGIQISDNELIELIKKIKEIVEENDIETTFFEFTTALAFQYFKEMDVDIAVIEVGLGGRLDATNVITPLVSVITNINLDHTNILGDTIEEIASEKAAIIKENIPVVTAEENKEVLKLFKDKCKEKNSGLFVVKDLINETEISLLGKHQTKNASIAMKTAELLNKNGFNISPENIQQGLKETNWPGRLQYISKNVLVDCAHNIAGMEYLADFVKNLPNRKVLVLGFSEDKEFKEMIKFIVPLFEKIIITEGNFKPLKTSIIASEVNKYIQDIEEIADVEEAVKRALILVKDDEFLLITGSIYMVGDALKYIQ